jgi:gamma-glutamylcyclotransferase
MSDVWYFAYGSNMDPARPARGAARGAPVLERIAGRLDGWRLAFDKRRESTPVSAAANIHPDPGGSVEGTLNRMAPLGLEVLDEYENVAKGHYRRLAVRVETADGPSVEAVAYVAEPAFVAPGLQPTRAYLDHLLAARDVLSEPYFRRLSSTVTIL